MTAQPIQFIDLAAQRQRLGPELETAILDVIRGGRYIMGPEVQQLESELATFCGARHAISCANGTDALGLVLMAKGVEPGDAIFCPTFTFAATAEVIAWLGAKPVFVDVLEDTFNMDPAGLAAAIGTAKQDGLRPKAIIPVDLFGQPAHYDAIEDIASESGLWILSDAAQSFGATYKGRKVGTIGEATATSFFPAKPLGCYGDGGAVFTEDDELAAIMRSIRVHGQGEDKYDNVRIGMNARLDTVQAAILLHKLKIFPDELERRQAVAQRYNVLLGNAVIVPRLMDGVTSAWAQYTIRVPGLDRSRLAASLKAKGVPTAIYYPKPLHEQTAYRVYVNGATLPTASRIADEVISLPMHPYLDSPVQDRIVAAVREALDEQR